MRTTTWNNLTLRITGGTDKKGAGDGPVVVLMHGFGAGGDDLVMLGSALLWAGLPKDVRFVFPAAPIQLEPSFGDSRAWWNIDFVARERVMATGGGVLDLSNEHPKGLDEAQQLITELLGDLGTILGGAPGRVVLGGFSQGAMLACDAALSCDAPLAGLILLSPTLLCRDRWQQLASKRAGLPVYQSHGQQDPVLSFSMSESLHSLLVEAGLDVTWQPFAGQHEIPQPVVAGLGTFVKQVVTN